MSFFSVYKANFIIFLYFFRLGLEPKVLASLVNTSFGRCWSSENYNPVPGVMPNVPSSNNYEGGCRTAIITKDLSLSQKLATDSCSPIPLGSISHQVSYTYNNFFLFL